jgi:heptose I phosphotransferase
VIELNRHLMAGLPAAEGAFEFFGRVQGKVHREVRNRRTVEFATGGRNYFVKFQRGCGWGEIAKNLVSFRLPVVSARNEWLAIEAAHRAGVATLTVAGRGLRGGNPARLESFVITEALEGMVSLEELAVRLASLPRLQRVRLNRALLRGVAEVARKFHGAGLNHRDFYLCHFLVHDRDWSQWREGDELQLVLIDLHRVQRRNAVPRRWLVKDLGGLFFSALDAGLTRRDWLRFVEHYRGRPWRELLANEAVLWKAVAANAAEMYRSFHRREPPVKP